MNYKDERFKDRLDSAVDSIKKILGNDIESIYVFGSLARNEGKLTSDIDLLISTKETIPTQELRWKLYNEICEIEDSEVNVDLKFCVQGRVNTVSKVFNSEVERDRVVVFVNDI